MAIKRNPLKSRSWFQRTAGSRGRRDFIAKSLKDHREGHFKFSSDFSGYFQGRTLEWLKERKQFDLKREAAARLAKKQKLYVLDSGAGNMFIGADLKKAFGNRIFVTSLNVLYPKMAKKTREKLEARIKAAKGSPARLIFENESAKIMEGKLADMLKAEENIKIVDECRVKPIETFSSKRKYGLIFDFYSPLQYSLYPERVLERYLSLLEPNGSVFTDVNLPIAFRTAFGAQGKSPQQKGYYFIVRKLPGGKIWELKKTKLRKK